MILKPWTFKLFPESRNLELYEALGLTYPRGVAHPWLINPVDVTLQPGTELIVRRVYVRQGQDRYNSVTFSGKVNKKAVRFWASLRYVNEMEVSLL